MIRKDFPAAEEHYFEERLENGLLVKVAEKPGFSKMFILLCADYGSVDTDYSLEGKHFHSPPGTAHFLEHMMFCLPEGKAYDQFARYGGAQNAITTLTMTAYYVQCTEHFEENLSVLLRMVSTPYFTAEDIEKERRVIEHENRMNGDHASRAATEQLLATMYPAQAFRFPAEGTEASIREITRETLDDCYRAFYDPSNLTLCVYGDVKAENVIGQARKQTRAGRGVKPVPDRITLTSEERQKKKVICHMDTATPVFSLGFRCDEPANGEAYIRTELTAQLAMELLLGKNAPLCRRLRDAGRIISLSSNYMTIRNQALVIITGTSIKPEQVMKEILAEAGRLASEGIDEERFHRLKKAAAGHRLRALDDFMTGCFQMFSYGVRDASCYDCPIVLERITKEEVESFLRDTISADRGVLSVVNRQ